VEAEGFSLHIGEYAVGSQFGELGPVDIIQLNTYRTAPGQAQALIDHLSQESRQPQVVRMVKKTSDQDVEVVLVGTQDALLADLAAQETEDKDARQAAFLELVVTATSVNYGQIRDDTKEKLEDLAINSSHKLNMVYDRPTLGWIGDATFSHDDGAVLEHFEKHDRSCCT